MQRTKASGTEEGDGIIGLVRETADGLGRLIADHIKLAQIEMVQDAKSYGRDVGVLVGAALVLVVGYLFGWVAVALAVARLIGGPLAFAAVAVPHLVLGAAAIVSAVRRLRRVRIMDDTAAEVSRSVGALTGPLTARMP
jgi:hypothetical protein